ncbi:hypothetical protein [Aeromonas cavernicola]|uniref:Uncharacterized protein n=1 Tax=Aeromonas cavernicola TaxID=1006623 RepID=A0A2H9U0R1_9GAMM|nr:hypothetical protein [Aeromonas cavernicola]PJG57646.1 hypothetical protein CUC53_16925 [Aeromonas cavernicola]
MIGWASNGRRHDNKHGLFNGIINGYCKGVSQRAELCRYGGIKEDAGIKERLLLAGADYHV